MTLSLREDILRALGAEPPLRLVVVFGSAARRGLRDDSDIDIGIIPRDADLALSAELDLQARLARACRRHVDLVRLDRASTLLRWEAARHAVPIIAEPPREFTRFITDAALDHGDFAWTFERAAERFRQRLLESAEAEP